MTNDGFQEKSDEELLAVEKEIRDERQRRQFQRDQSVRKTVIEKIQFIRDNPDFLKIFVPTHTRGRYGRDCNDDNLSGAFYQPVERKDWFCKRCCILMAIKYWEPNYTADLPDFELFVSVVSSGGLNAK